MTETAVQHRYADGRLDDRPRYTPRPAPQEIYTKVIRLSPLNTAERHQVLVTLAGRPH